LALKGIEMLRKLYNGLVFVLRPIRALLAPVRRLPLWAQLAILAIVIVGAGVLVFLALILPFPCPPDNPQCGPWEQLKQWWAK
jgi:hypothetical protein